MNNLICFSSLIGPISILASAKGISSILLDGISRSPSTPSQEILKNAKTQVLEYLEGKQKSFDIPLDWDSIQNFQRQVLKITLTIPYGEIFTYGQIARMLGKPQAARAVGGALSRNPIPILIPCHRVVSSTGALTGYTGAEGIVTKRFLLELEGRKVVGQKLA